MFVQCIVYCVQCTPSPLWLKSVPGWPAISVITWQESRVGQIVWFGCLSAISQLASREGEGGGVRQLCLHSVTQPFPTWPRWREQGGGLCSLPCYCLADQRVIQLLAGGMPRSDIVRTKTICSARKDCPRICNQPERALKHQIALVFNRHQHQDPDSAM
jgi:hypothetical protein